LQRRWFPKVTITLYEPRHLAIPPELRGRARRHRAGLVLYDAMSDMMARRPDPPDLFGALLAARAAHGGNHPIMADPTGGPLGYNRVIAASLVFGRRLARHTERGEAVGVMLPNSIGAGVAFFALQATGRVPAMLNHTAGIDSVLSACRTARLCLVITSRRFIELLQSSTPWQRRLPKPSRSSGSRTSAQSSGYSTSSTDSSRRSSPGRGTATLALPLPTRP
jgi:acyl-[acyl-carrier-protein]-phospholipid O-acyltransferase/long-chain-fatty-acid--[acyl-carrier-protein] ligase